MLIIIEGPDKIGKSTLINALSKKIPCIIIKNCNRPISNDDTNLKKSYQTILQFIKQNHKEYNIILDRFYPSQMVYSILRGKDSFKDNWYNDFEKQVAETKPLYVYCVNQFKTIKERHLLKKDEYIKINQLRMLIRRYDFFYSLTELPKMRLDLYPPNFDNSLEKLVRLIKNG